MPDVVFLKSHGEKVQRKRFFFVEKEKDVNKLEMS